LWTQYGSPARGRATSATPPSARIDLVLEYIHENLADDLSLLTLAELAGVSVRRLMQLFKQRTGCSPHRYVLHQPITVARALLSNADSSIAQVAVAVGFVDQAHFSTAFRKITGFSPGAYQRAAKH